MSKERAGSSGKNHRGEAVVAILVAQVLFSTHYAMTKQVLAYLPALGWVGLRAVFVTAVLGGLVYLQGSRLPHGRKEWQQVAIIALFGVVLNQVLFTLGLSKTSTIHAAVLNAMTPAFTAVVSVGIGNERWSKRLVVALGAATFGAIVLVQAGGHERGSSLVGDGLMLAFVLANSTSAALISRVAKRYHLPAGTITLGMFLCGLPCVLALAVPSLMGVNFATIPSHVWWYAAAIAVGPVAAGFFLKNYALTVLRASTVGLFANLQTLIAATIGVVLLHEVATWRFAIAAVLIGSALTIAATGQRRS